MDKILKPLRASGGDTDDYVIELRYEILMYDNIFMCGLRDAWSVFTFLGTVLEAATSTCHFDVTITPSSYEMKLMPN